MSRAAEVALRFADGDRLFRLPIGRWRAIQERCDAGPMELLRRYMEGGWRVDDVREVLLQGLIGGGEPQADASRLMERFFDDLPLAQFVPLAQAVVMASVVGAGDEDVGEPKAPGAKTRRRSRARSSDSPPSTARVPRSASRRETSTS